VILTGLEKLISELEPTSITIFVVPSGAVNTEEFTVGIEIANSTGRKIENVTVKDFIPSVFDIKEGEGLKPVKKKTAAGAELTWKLKDVHKNEVRILSYKILPAKLYQIYYHFLQRLSLPAVSARKTGIGFRYRLFCKLAG